MNKIVKEVIFFLLFSYFAIWVTFPVLEYLELKINSSLISTIDELFLFQLWGFTWFLILLTFYIIRLLVYFIVSKFM